MIGLQGKQDKVKVKDDPGFWASNLVNPLLFGEMGQMGEAQIKSKGENTESVWSFLFPPLPPTSEEHLSSSLCLISSCV